MTLKARHRRSAIILAWCILLGGLCLGVAMIMGRREYTKETKRLEQAVTKEVTRE